MLSLNSLTQLEILFVLLAAQYLQTNEDVDSRNVNVVLVSLSVLPIGAILWLTLKRVRAAGAVQEGKDALRATVVNPMRTLSARAKAIYAATVPSKRVGGNGEDEAEDEEEGDTGRMRDVHAPPPDDAGGEAAMTAVL